MSLYANRIAFLAPVEHADACNRAANALGRTGFNFGVRLSATGQEPATHIGGSAVETDLFVQAVRNASVATPEGVDPLDWQAVADHLTLVDGPADVTNAARQFLDMVDNAGLQRVVQVDDE